jgi:DHA1 family bicyclomycin/chloramphenicol resistance-like MFS transporter
MNVTTRPSPKLGVLVFILATLTAFGPLSIDMYLPAFPQIANDFHTSIVTVQLSLTSFFLGLALGQLFYGPVIDRFGRKPPVYFGLVVYGLASILCAVAPSVEILILGRFLQALGACAGMVVSRAVVRDLYEERDAARVFSLLMLVMGVAPILAPIVGGYITTHWGWHSVFGLLGSISLICLFAVFAVLPETRGPNPLVKLSSALQTYGSIAKNRRFIGYTISGALAQAGMFAYITGSPFVFIELFKVPAAHYGWIFGSNAFGLIAASQINVRLLKKTPPEKILRYSFGILALASISLVLATVARLGFWGLVIPLFVYIATLGITLPNTAAAALSSEGARAGSASAFLGTMQFTLAAITSAAVSSFDTGTSMPMSATMASCGALGLWVFSRVASKS